MKDVIEQITRIDKVAFENEQMNQDILAEEEQKYQSKMQNDREERLTEAHRRADGIYHQIIEEVHTEVVEKTSQSAKKIEQLKMQFLKVEKDVIGKIVEKLFLMEKEG